MKKKFEPIHIEPGLNPILVDIDVVMNKKFRERPGAQAFEYNRTYVSIDKITRNKALLLP